VITTSSKGEKTTIKVIKSKLTDRKGDPVFKAKKVIDSNTNSIKATATTKDTDFYLLTNQEINNPQDAYKIYLSYFLRWKIETVFKFLKDSVGLEEFRVEKYEAIKNIISLTFLIGAYLMELGDISIDDEFLISIAKLGRGKGAVTKYFIMQGLQELTHYIQVQDYFDKHKIPPQQQKEMLDYVRTRIV
jgi:Transposase DDE domain